MTCTAAQHYVDDAQAAPLAERPAVKCDCGRTVFDGLVVLSRVVRALPRGGAEAKCKCKRWVRVPLTYDPEAGERG